MDNYFAVVRPRFVLPIHRYRESHCTRVYTELVVYVYRLKLGELRTKRAVVEAALYKYVRRCEQLVITKLFRSIEYEDDDDYKQQRRN